MEATLTRAQRFAAALATLEKDRGLRRAWVASQLQAKPATLSTYLAQARVDSGDAESGYGQRQPKEALVLRIEAMAADTIGNSAP